MKRCAWVPLHDQEYMRYHDVEWSVPTYDDRTLFEFIVLESAQAGLSWSTILHRREGYRTLFYEFDPALVTRMTENDIERLMGNARIIRNRAKIKATILNAQAFIRIKQEYGTFSEYLWSWTNGTPVTNSWKQQSDVPTVTLLSILIAKDLKKRGFCFMGPTTCYAYMQAIGMVNDHICDCFRYEEINSSAIHSTQNRNCQ